MPPIFIEIKDGEANVVLSHVDDHVIIRNLDKGEHPFTQTELLNDINTYTLPDSIYPTGEDMPTFFDEPYEEICTIPVKIKKIHSDAILPAKMTVGAAGFDLHSVEYVRVLAGCTQAIPTGFSLEIPPDYEGQVRSRSGLALKHNVHVMNSPGTIDSDYRGEIKVILHNAGSADFNVYPGDRVAQLLFQYVPPVRLIEVDELAESERGNGGFGHTGI